MLRPTKLSKNKPCMHSVRCKKCHKAFTFDCHELDIQRKFAYTDGYDYDVDFYNYWADATCPYCGEQVRVYEETSWGVDEETWKKQKARKNKK